MAREEANRLRYLLGVRKRLTRLVARTKADADALSVKASEASVTASLAEIRAYEAAEAARRWVMPDGTLAGREYKIARLHWTTSKRRIAEINVGARDRAAAAFEAALKTREALHEEAAEAEADVLFLEGRLAEAEDALRPWGGPEGAARSLSFDEALVQAAVDEMSGPEILVAFRRGEIPASRCRALLTMMGLDDLARTVEEEIEAAIAAPSPDDAPPAETPENGADVPVAAEEGSPPVEELVAQILAALAETPSAEPPPEPAEAPPPKIELIAG